MQVSEEGTVLLAEREGKVAAVIKTLREALRALDAKLYVRPLLTSYSALGDIHGALGLIKEAKEEQLAKESGQEQGEPPHHQEQGRGGAPSAHVAEPPCCLTTCSAPPLELQGCTTSR